MWTNARGDRQLGTSSRIVFVVLGDGSGYFLVFAALTALALIGLRRLSRIDPGMRAVLVYLAVCLVTYGFFYFGQHRYRVPMEPFLILVATPLLTGLWALRGRLRPTGA